LINFKTLVLYRLLIGTDPNVSINHGIKNLELEGQST